MAKYISFWGNESPFLKNGFFSDENLYRPLGPPESLLERGPEVFGREAVGQHFRIKDAFPAKRMQTHGGGHVFGDADGGEGLHRHRFLAAGKIEGLQIFLGTA